MGNQQTPGSNQRVVAGLTAEERETIVNVDDTGAPVRISTSIRRDISAMRKNSRFTEVASGHYGTTEWAEFTIPAAEWSPCGVRYRRAISPEQKAVRAARLREVRPSAASSTSQTA